MKTILISSFHPFISRNILATELLGILTRQGVRVVVLIPKKKEAYFQEEFAQWIRAGVTFEPVVTNPSWRDRFINYLALSALQTRSLRLKRETEMRGRGKWANPILSSALGKHMVRTLHLLMTPRGTFDSIFKRYEPRTVFITDVNSLFDMRLAHDARNRHIAVLGMVRSWDNLTAKGYLRMVPDKLLVHSETEKEEAINLHGVPPRNIEIVGIPHYDRYVQREAVGRDAFFKQLGIPLNKRLVLFTPTGDRYLTENTIDLDIVRFLDKELPEDCHILVRLPPTDTVHSLERFQGSRVTIERPSTRFKTFKNIELAPGDDEHLADTLSWSDLVITGPSTICIDAAFFDKPVILVAYDGKSNRSYLTGLRRYYDYNHWDPILKSGGAWMVESEDAFRAALKAYLRDPELHATGRQHIVLKEAYKRDGKATERLAEELLSALS